MVLFSYTLCFRYVLLSDLIYTLLGTLSKPKGTIYINYKEIFEKWTALYPAMKVSYSYFMKNKPAWISKGKIEECLWFVYFSLIFQVHVVPVNWESKGPAF